MKIRINNKIVDTNTIAFAERSPLIGEDGHTLKPIEEGFNIHIEFAGGAKKIFFGKEASVLWDVLDSEALQLQE